MFLEPCQPNVSGALSGRVCFGALPGPMSPEPCHVSPCQNQWFSGALSGPIFLEPLQAQFFSAALSGPMFLEPLQAQCFWSLCRSMPNVFSGALEGPMFLRALSGPMLLELWFVLEPCRPHVSGAFVLEPCHGQAQVSGAFVGPAQCV